MNIAAKALLIALAALPAAARAGACAVTLTVDGEEWTLPDKDADVFPMQTTRMCSRGRRVARVVVTTPRLFDDLNVFSRPASYISVYLSGATNWSAAVSLPSDGDAPLVTNRCTVAGLPALAVGRADGSGCRKWLVGPCGAKDGERHFIVAREDTRPIVFRGARLVEWWRRSGTTFEEMLSKAAKERADVMKRAAAFDSEMMDDLERAGGEEFGVAAAAAFRRAFRPFRLAADANNQPLLVARPGHEFRDVPAVALLAAPTLARAALAPGLLAVADGRLDAGADDARRALAFLAYLELIDDGDSFTACWRGATEKLRRSAGGYAPKDVVAEACLAARDGKELLPAFRHERIRWKWALRDKASTHLYAPLKSGGDAMPGDESAFNLASFNIRCPADKEENAWSNRLPRVVRVMKERGFDIMGVQEATPEQRADLDAALGGGWARVGVGRELDDMGEAMCIYYRKDRFECLAADTFWLSKTPKVPASKSWHSACRRVCTWGLFRDRRTGRTFRYFNTHLDHISSLARVKGMKTILDEMKRISQGETVFLTGDLNDSFERIPAAAQADLLRGCGPQISSEITFEHPIFAASLVLYDTLFRVESPHEGPLRTFHGYQPENKVRIDYVFATGDVRVLRHVTCADRPDGLYPSDHDAVMVRVAIR